MELQTCRPEDPGFPDSLAAHRDPAVADRGCDSRYRSIFGQLDVMIETVRRHPECDQRDALRRLLQGMRHHFAAENASMGLVGYPDSASHSFQHQSICVSAVVLGQRLAGRQFLVPEELTGLRTLWLEHIKVHDRAFEEFLTS